MTTTAIVERIKSLRNMAGMTQEQMAKMLGMSRLTYINIESGQRPLKEKEIEKIAPFFEMSVEELHNGVKVRNEQLISKDHPHYKMIQTILYILTKCAGKPNVGKIVLNKLLYFADFNHYEKYWESITGDQYIKMPMGPVPKSIDEVIALMKEHALVEEISPLFHGYKQMRYIPNQEADITRFSATEIAEIDYVIQKYGDFTGRQLTEASHNDGPRKYVDELGGELEYGMVHYRNPLYSVTDQTIFDDDDDEAFYTHSMERGFREE